MGGGICWEAGAVFFWHGICTGKVNSKKVKSKE
jgi:hypothetical protein